MKKRNSSKRVWYGNHKRLLMALAASAVLLVPGLALAQWSTDAAVNTPVVTFDGEQGSAKIVSDDDAGGYFVVWHDYRDADNDIYAQYFDASGVALWTSGGVAVSAVVEDQSYPKAVSDGTGGIIISWVDERDGGEEDIYAQRVDADGAMLWTSGGVSVMETVSCGWLASDGAGGAIIADKYGMVNKVASDGSLPWDSPVELSDSGEASKSKIVMDGSGGAILVWTDDLDGNEMESVDNIYVQRIDSSGALLWNSGAPLALTDTDESNCPRIISDGGDGYIIVWNDDRTLGKEEVYAQKINGSGVAQWTDGGVLIVQGDSLGSYSHEPAPDGSGGAFVIWANEDDDTMYAQWIDADGDLVWEDAVPLSTGGDYYDVSDAPVKIVANGSNGFITAWINDSEQVIAQSCDAQGTLLWGADGLVVSDGNSLNCGPRLATNGEGGVVAVWVDDRDATGKDIYIQGVSADGELGDPGYTPPSTGGGGSSSSGGCFITTAAESNQMFGCVMALIAAVCALGSRLVFNR